MAGNFRVAKNALYLYTRTIVNMVVGIFTVRIMMEALGVEDYGLQNVAGAVLGMFSLLIDGLGTSTSRFITFELGRGDLRRINETFCTTMVVFIGIAALMVILGETIGLWMLRNKLVIPEGRETAAEVVFHLSVLSAAIGIPQAPYGACMVAHEKFNVSAYISLFSTFARLGILYLISQSQYDHLILYAVSMFLLGLSTLIYSRIYCIRNFPECKLHLRFNRDLFKPMLKFSGWETFGAINRTCKGTGYQMALNMFHGVSLNAAIGIGSTVSGAVTGMAFTVTSAFKPRIVKFFARNDYKSMKDAIRTSTLISMVFYGVFAMPLLVELDYVMALWLPVIPPLSRDLCFIQLVLNCILMGYLVPAESLKSMGRNAGVNIMQLIDGTLSLGTVVLILSLGLHPLLACTAFHIGLLSNFTLTLWLMSRHTGRQYIKELFTRSIGKVLIAEAAIFCILYLVHQAMGPSLLTLIVVCMLSVVLFAVVSFRWLLDRDHAENLRLYIRSRLASVRTT